jgi:hypothetical protein
VGLLGVLDAVQRRRAELGTPADVPVSPPGKS